jgi:hypothetical protein
MSSHAFVPLAYLANKETEVSVLHVSTKQISDGSASRNVVSPSFSYILLISSY